MKSLFLTAFLVLLNVFRVAAAEQTLAEPAYTEDLTEFKDKKNYNARSEKLLACWLYLRQEDRKAEAATRKQHQWLHLMKKCMKRITRKDSVLKITELGKRNMAPVTPFASIMDMQSELAQELGQSPQTQFDQFLLDKSQDFEKQLAEILEKGNIDGQIEEELKKRQKYYFGIIPASMVNHTTILVTLTMLMMCCCTWCRFNRTTTDKLNYRRNKTEKNVVDEEDEHMLKSKGSRNGKRRKIN